MNAKVFVLGISLIGCTEPLNTSSTEDALSGASVLNDWSVRIASTGTTVGENALRTQVRLTMAHMAMYDAVNAIAGGFKPYASNPVAAADASPEAAVIAAAYTIAANEFPTQLATLTTAYDNSLAGLTASDQEKADGILVGQAAAAAVLAKRVGDHRNDPELEGWSPGRGPGVWQPTPPAFANPQTPFLQFVHPFTFDDPSRYRLRPPPALDSRRWANDYNEVKSVGTLTGSTRTPEQTATAQFWSPSASAIWSANIRTLGATMDIATAARFEAKGFAALMDALIAEWDSKYTYVFWRPVTAIPAGDTDDNSRTDPDPAWQPLITTPAHPEYPSAHATNASAVLTFYADWFGSDSITVTVVAGAQSRTYTNVQAVVEETSNARVWSGIHYRNSVEAGAKLGRKVGHHAAAHLARPIHDHDDDDDDNDGCNGD